MAAAKDDRGSGMLAAVAGIGVAVGLEVVAEGVETGEELTVLNELGYAFAQGYHFAMPSSPDALAALLHGERDPVAA